MLWSLLYGTLTRLLLGAAVLALPLIRRFRPKTAKWLAMRYYPRALRFQPRLWIHAVSVGEIQIARALLAHLDAEEVLLTTTTQAGYQLLRQAYGHERVRYLPWDLPACYRRLFGAHKAPHLIVVETEIWPGLFRYVTAHGASVVIVNGRVSDKTLRLRNNALFRATLSRVSRILARGKEDAARFMAFGVPADRVRTVGNIKFDARPGSLPESPLTAWLAAPHPLILFASISADEAAVLAPELAHILQARPDMRALWAPRHLEHLATHLTALADLAPQCRSTLTDDAHPRVLVLDSFGELSGTYASAALALVGGSFNQRGGQNFIESLQSGTPVLVGPSTDNFREETDEALRKGALVRVETADRVADTCIDLLAHPEKTAAMAASAERFLSEHGGAIERTLQELLHLNLISSHRTKGERP